MIARSHPGPGPALVHVDAYRLDGAVEVEDLDLDADLERAVTVVEWGAGKVEGLAADRLEVLIRRDVGRPSTPRTPPGGGAPSSCAGWVRAGRGCAWTGSRLAPCSSSPWTPPPRRSVPRWSTPRADVVLGRAGVPRPGAHGEQLAPLVARALELAGAGAP